MQQRQLYIRAQVKPEPQNPSAPMDTGPQPTSPQEASEVKAEPPIVTSGNTPTDPASLTPAPGAQQMEVAGREGGVEAGGTAAVGVKTEPSQDSLMQEASLQVSGTAQHVLATCCAKTHTPQTWPRYLMNIIKHESACEHPTSGPLCLTKSKSSKLAQKPHFASASLQLLQMWLHEGSALPAHHSRP